MKKSNLLLKISWFSICILLMASSFYNTSYAEEVDSSILENIWFEWTVNQDINWNLTTTAILDTNNHPISSIDSARIYPPVVTYKQNKVHNTGIKEDFMILFTISLIGIFSIPYMRKKNLI